ncbi:Glu/Leu/Phe/Val dehydrogenase dimerization domain-containing protein [Tomitella cavernea]|uniref:Glu/Leu/Phe/Val dehydrogenase dimerization domain-containing protein n=2 Tax=Tomitella cavernea TaxID=1387982 RepID=A0ABP9C5G8_9ACTN|nr:Glu/Leu/Phe/Val dehydrogenase dimerization domain-containing protein [Tomitella cavernea]
MTATLTRMDQRTSTEPDTDGSPGVFAGSARLTDRPHEQVVHMADAETGLRAIIAIHSTTLGPALGGTRFYPFPTEAAALDDALRLSLGMTYKSAVAGADLGGGKAVIIGDPAAVKTEALLGAYGRFVEALGGRYITAADVGTDASDLDVIGRHTDHVVGCTAGVGGSGDSSYLTALGVYESMRAGARHVWGADGPGGLTVGVEGVGKVGSELVRMLVDAGADVVVTDVNAAAVGAVLERFPGVRAADGLGGERIDVYAPCALGGTLTPGGVDGLDARLVCGSSNNQLSDACVDTLLATRGITWVPDYLANAGGLIQVAGERAGDDGALVESRVRAIGGRAAQILDRARAEGTTPGHAADKVAEERIDGA